MGRPIKKDFIGSDSGSIRVTRYRFTGESEATSPAGYMVAQKGTTKFRVSDGSTTETLVLVDKTGSLAEGEFAIDATLNDSSVVQVTKLKNRTITYDDSAQVGYTRTGLDAGDDGDDRANIDIIA